VVLATDGTAASSPAAQAALSWLASDLPRTSLPPETRERTTPAGAFAAIGDGGLGAALGDLVTALARSGTRAADGPAIREALARVGTASASIEVARWVGRVRAALAARDEIGLARLVADAHALEVDPEPERMIDCTLIELGRELLDGLTPLAIERRHLLDPRTGAILAEERLRDQPASNGPCPRVVSAGLATRTATGRVRIVQYSVATFGSDEAERVETLAATSLADAFAAAEKGGLRGASREPVSLLRVAAPDGGIVRDPSGAPIPLARSEDAAAVTALVDALGKGSPAWMLGRWSLAGDEAALVPLSCSVDGRFVRLR
jgi:hypothetical protein